jgi:putative AlgH/UPF0301 family transcriptional regulator
MKPQKNLMGQILVAIPNTHHSHFVRGLLLVTSHWSVGTSSVMFNKPLNTNYTVGSVLRNAGIESNRREPLFFGGLDETNRVQFIHSLDWATPNTKQITEEIGLTADNSILTAIAADDGPRYWRCCMGQRMLVPGNLEGEILGEPPWDPGDRWMTVPATLDLVFSGTGDEQWISAIETAAKTEVDTWF